MDDIEENFVTKTQYEELLRKFNAVFKVDKRGLTQEAEEEYVKPPVLEKEFYMSKMKDLM